MTKRSLTNPQPSKARWGNKFGVKHDMSGSAEYKAWKSMRRRCFNENMSCFADYGGRGITVCDSWKDSFEAFFADMGPRPSKEHSLDRINNDGNYEPGNCRWASRKTQVNNRRVSVLLTWDGKTMCAEDWALLLGVKPNAIRNRIASGWTVEKTLSTPIRHWNRRLK